MHQVVTRGEQRDRARALAIGLLGHKGAGKGRLPGPISNFSSQLGQRGGAIVEAIITTMEGVMTANNGDWIIKGVKGEIYPCKDEIFRMTYEAVSSEE